MEYTVIAEPTAEPVTLAEVRQFLRLISSDDTEDTTILSPMITAARQYCENLTGAALAEQTIEAYPSEWAQVMILPRGTPLTAVQSIVYLDAEGTEATLSPPAYSVQLAVGGVVLLDIPQVTLFPAHPIRVRYTAGSATIPALMRQAMLMLIAYWYDNRESVAVGTVSAEMALSTGAILKQYKGWWF